MPRAKKNGACQVANPELALKAADAPERDSEPTAPAAIPPGSIVINFADERKRRWQAFITSRLRQINEEICTVQLKAWQNDPEHTGQPFPPEMYRW